MISIKIDAEGIFEPEQVRIQSLSTRKILAERDFLEQTQLLFLTLLIF
ncbi:MAG: hypothetical protein JJU02_03150 [Cryomorphaceae bacterium]|nr:hypothetical protein [Cryomorphaceae bacterium]